MLLHALAFTHCVFVSLLPVVTLSAAASSSSSQQHHSVDSANQQHQAASSPQQAAAAAASKPFTQQPLTEPRMKLAMAGVCHQQLREQRKAKP
jgi:hypothetical protein